MTTTPFPPAGDKAALEHGAALTPRFHANCLIATVATHPRAGEGSGPRRAPRRPCRRRAGNRLENTPPAPTRRFPNRAAVRAGGAALELRAITTPPSPPAGHKAALDHAAPLTPPFDTNGLNATVPTQAGAGAGSGPRRAPGRPCRRRAG